jgi:hypothetical protein
LAPHLDQLLHDLEVALNALQLGARELRQSGTTLPTDMQVQACWRCIAVMLSRTPFANMTETHLTGPEKASFGAFTPIINNWADSAIRDAERVLQATDQTNKAA